MIKRLAIAATVVAVLTMILLSYVTARFVDQKEILRATNELRELRDDGEKLQKRIESLTTEQANLTGMIAEKDKEIERNHVQIDKLESDRKEAQLTVRRLRTPRDQLVKFEAAYPQVARVKGFGVTEILDETENIRLDFLCVPLTFAETFVIEHDRANNFQAQLGKYVENERLYGDVITLNNQVLKLEAEKATAWSDAYGKVFTKYEDLNGRYIELMQKPPVVKFNVPHWPLAIGAAVLGIAVGRVH